jgi:hypothetical protein
MADQHLHAGEEIVSLSGQYHLTFQADGNLVLYDAGIAVWHTDTWDRPNKLRPICARMQEDGNLVLYTCSNQAAWSSGSDGRGGAYLAIQDDRNVVIYTQGGDAVWATDTMKGHATRLEVTGVLLRSRNLVKEVTLSVLANLIAGAIVH